MDEDGVEIETALAGLVRPSWAAGDDVEGGWDVRDDDGPEWS